jgi:hypothetical protein
MLKEKTKCLVKEKDFPYMFGACHNICFHWFYKGSTTNMAFINQQEQTETLLNREIPVIISASWW